MEETYGTSNPGFCPLHSFMLYWLWGKTPGVLNTTDNGDMDKRIFTVPILESIFKEIEKKI